MSEPVVIKVGGSLFAEPGALREVGRWFEATHVTGQTRLVIAGGGATVDALRAIDAANPLPSEVTHWAAIRLMDANTRLLPHWLSGLSVSDQLPRGGTDQALLCEPFLQQAEPSLTGKRLSVGWDTTSDAIAARLAEIIGGRLVLLKHTVDASIDSLEAARQAGLIDPETPRHAARLAGVELLGVAFPGLPARRPRREGAGKDSCFFLRKRLTPPILAILLCCSCGKSRGRTTSETS
ncbi:MAG: hypothetical protein AAF266_07865 [Planctomycetota bacterium]